MTNASMIGNVDQKEKLIFIERDLWHKIYAEVANELKSHEITNDVYYTDIISHNIAYRMIWLVQRLVFGDEVPDSSERCKYYKTSESYDKIVDRIFGTFVKETVSAESMSDTFIEILPKPISEKYQTDQSSPNKRF